MTKLEQMREAFSRLEGSGLSMKASTNLSLHVTFPSSPTVLTPSPPRRTMTLP